MTTRRLTEVKKVEGKPADSRFAPTCDECGKQLIKREGKMVCPGGHQQ